MSTPKTVKLALSTLNIFLLLLLSAHSPKPPDLAYIIAGEASTCPAEAKIAVAYMVHRGAKFNGYAWPDQDSINVALNWYNEPDHSQGAQFWFDENDLDLPEVKAIISDRAMVAQFDCSGIRVRLFR